MNLGMYSRRTGPLHRRWLMFCVILACLGMLNAGCFNAIVIGGDDEFAFPKSDGGTGAVTDTPSSPDTAPPPPPDVTQPPPPPDVTQPPPDVTQPPPPDVPPPPPDIKPPPDVTQPPPPDDRDPGCPGECKPGQRRSCYSGPAGTAGKGLCQAGVQICDTLCRWGSCLGETKPAAEACDGLDNNCNGQVDESFPGAGTACKVGNRPGVCGTGKLTCQAGKQVCVAGTPGPEVCDGQDNNCDGKVDNLPDTGQPCTVPGGKGECGKGLWACRSNRKTCVPYASTTEVCDGKDNDCDGAVDESDARLGKTCTVPSQKGVCQAGTYRCSAGKLTCQSNAKPTPEKCDGLDNDCDGMVDNNVGAVCYTGPAANRGVGECVTGRISCVNGKPGSCVGSVLPSTEVCDSLDNDCDGQVDEGNVCVKPGAGPAFRITSLAIAGSGVGFDLNGDGQKDNSLSVLGTFVNSTLQQAITSGAANVLIELANLSDKTAQSGTGTVYLYTGLAGSGGYYIDRSSLDSNQRPLFRFAAKINAGLLTAGPGRAILNLPLLGSATPIRLENAYIQFRIASSLQTLSSGLLGGAIPAIVMDLIPAAGIPIFGGPGKTALDVLLQLGKQPDVDLDRDGLETFQFTATAGVTVCIDGNKITKITGGNCPRDSRIADGLSVTFTFTATRTKLLGASP